MSLVIRDIRAIRGHSFSLFLSVCSVPSVANAPFFLQHTTNMKNTSPTDSPPEEDSACPQLYQVVVQCAGEDQQRDLYEEMQERGLPCKLLML